MGALLSSFTSEKISSLILDLEGAQPSESERNVYNEVQAVLDRSNTILNELSAYPGCEKFIRDAITSPGPETEESAWNAVLPAVEQLKSFYDFSGELQEIFPKLLNALAKDDPTVSLTNQQALAKQMANVLDFVLRFDDLKMQSPAIQNDFSYYRRSLNRLKMTKGEKELTIRDELANKMSLFFAYPTPMMNVINETTAKFMNEHSAIKENVVTGLGMMANVCYEMVQNKKFEQEATNMFALRAMVGCIILFDHLSPQGAFHKKSIIRIKECIITLKGFKTTSGSTDGLVNALKFTTVHLNDPDTAQAIKSLLD
jgi:hypothetical protein